MRLNLGHSSSPNSSELVPLGAGVGVALPRAACQLEQELCPPVLGSFSVPLPTSLELLPLNPSLGPLACELVAGMLKVPQTCPGVSSAAGAQE